MYSSPHTPTGTGSNRSSSTYTRTFPSGRPMCGGPSFTPSGSTCAIVVATVFSAGPYTFTSSAFSSLRGLRCSLSPPVKSHFSTTSRGHGSSSTASAMGVAMNDTVILSSASHCTSRLGSALTSSSGMCTLAPAMRLSHTSQTDTSKDKPTTSVVLSSGFTSYLRWYHLPKLTRLRCVTATPLGLPVEPDV